MVQVGEDFNVRVERRRAYLLARCYKRRTHQCKTKLQNYILFLNAAGAATALRHDTGPSES